MPCAQEHSNLWGYSTFEFQQGFSFWKGALNCSNELVWTVASLVVVLCALFHVPGYYQPVFIFQTATA